MSIIFKLKTLWQGLSVSEAQTSSEVEKIAALHQAACQRRAEYANKQEQALAGDDPSLLSACRARVVEAEAAHAAALRNWENKNSRQRSH